MYWKVTDLEPGWEGVDRTGLGHCPGSHQVDRPLDRNIVKQYLECALACLNMVASVVETVMWKGSYPGEGPSFLV